ncbi:hypothetical protein ACFRMN_19295 [Streptomyces sp. NPDC056835]|uniref:hypothetical protein n=1 Tax=Streptomyces sp. NPDC056835 TaxID=3345956 RepID=UPI0036AD2734
MSTHQKPPGRLRGGLSHFWGQTQDRFHLAAFNRKNGRRLAWSLMEGAIGSAVGLLFAALYLAYR